MDFADIADLRGERAALRETNKGFGIMVSHYDIAFDISFLPSTGGFGTYTTQCLEQFVRQDSQRKYLLLENELPLSVPQYQNREENRKERLPILPDHWFYEKTSRKSRVAWMLFDLPRQLKRHRPRIFFSVDNVTVPSRRDEVDSVLVLHDTIPISHPQYCRLRDALACRWLIGRAIRNASRIITISHYSADQILHFYPKTEKKLTVIPNGVDHQRFHPIANREAMAEKLASRYGFYSPNYLLIVTTLSPRRNLEGFLQAYAHHLNQTQEKKSCLVIAGCRGWKDQTIFQIIQSLDLSHRIHFLDYVTDEELIQLVQSASVLVNPSLLEGFGLTILEAMACGTPVLCSSTTALGEVAGEAALTVDPLRIDSMAKGLTVLLKDSSLQEELSRKGIERAQQFRWEQTTQRILDMFNTINP